MCGLLVSAARAEFSIMPEGDTIHKVANYLASRLVERIVRSLRVTKLDDAAQCQGQRVRDVIAEGKHLYIEFDNGMMLRSHLGMYGAWHRYREGESWRKPRWQASMVLATDDEVYVCFNAKEIEFLRSTSVRERILHTRLGPDLVRADADIEHAVRRARELLDGDTLLADVLLDQRAACGIGNVYKSEVLFLERRLPHTLLSALTDDELASCFTRAATLLRSNLGGGRRVTRFESDRAGRLWAYGRGGLPCLRCEERIRTARLGKHQRNTYWCAGCQS